MASVTFPEELGGNGQTYTDDADPNTGLDGLGYTVRFIPCLQQAVAMGLSAQSNAQAAADYVQQCQTLRQEVAADRQAVADDRTHVDQQKGLVDTAAGQVATDKQAVADDRTHIDQQKGLVDSAAGQVATDRQAVADDRTHIDQQKGLVDDAAGQVATDRQAVADDRLASQQAAGASSDAADTSIQARNEAQALYGDLNAVETAKTQAQQAATDAGEERGLAQTARAGAETAQEAAETAAGQSEGAANAAITDLKENFLGAAAQREVIGPDAVPLMSQGYGGIGVTEFLADADAANIPTGFYRVTDASFAVHPAGGAGGAFDGTLIHINVLGQTDQYLRISGFNTLSRVDDGDGIYTDWSRTYTQANALSPVSESSGIPTGGIMEEDSNDDGRYVKFFSGSMISTKILETTAGNAPNGALWISESVDWLFPAQYAEPPAISHMVKLSASGANPIGATAPASSPTHHTVNGIARISVWYQGASDTCKSQIHLTAVGHWYLP